MYSEMMYVSRLGEFLKDIRTNQGLSLKDVYKALELMKYYRRQREEQT